MPLEDLKFDCRTAEEELHAYLELERLFHQAWEAAGPGHDIGGLLATAYTWSTHVRSERGYWLVLRNGTKVLRRMPVFTASEQTTVAHTVRLLRQAENEYDYLFPDPSNRVPATDVFEWKNFDSGARRQLHDKFIAEHT